MHKATLFSSFWAMKMRILAPTFFSLLLAASSFLLAVCDAYALQQQEIAKKVTEPRPNVILIMTDDQGIGDLGVNGNRVIETPNIDRLASQSVSFKNFYVHPVCAPTRACLMTGRYNYRTRAIDTYVGRAMMDPAEVTIAEVLRDSGYRTGIFGKWHLGDCYPMRAMDQGFDTAVVHRGGGIGQPSDPLDGQRKYTDPVLFRNGIKETFKGYCTDVYYDEAMKFIDEARKSKKPFFAYIPDNTPHGPFHDVPKDLYDHYVEKNITAESFGEHPGQKFGDTRPDFLARVFAMISNVDRNVGRLLKKLDDEGLTENTIVIFMCDNGPNSDRYKMGLRGHKGSVYEGGIRTPFFVRWPGHAAAGNTDSTAVAHIDVMPTLLDLCSVKKPQQLKFDGRSLSRLLQPRNEESLHRLLFIQAHRGNQPKENHHVAIIGQTDRNSRRWKLVHASGFGKQSFEGQPKYELYDLKNDPYEQTDLAGKYPEVVKQMKAAYNKWFEDVGTTREDNYAPPRIVISPEVDAPTVLTRQDWRRSDEQGWGNRGRWLVTIEEPCKTTITCWLRQNVKAESITFRLLDASGKPVLESNSPTSADKRSAKMVDTSLPVGDYAIEVSALVQVKKKGETQPTEQDEGAYQVHIELAK